MSKQILATVQVSGQKIVCHYVGLSSSDAYKCKGKNKKSKVYRFTSKEHFNSFKNIIDDTEN